MAGGPASRDSMSRPASWWRGTPKQAAGRHRCSWLVKVPSRSRQHRRTFATQSRSQVRLSVGDSDDVQGIILSEKAGQPETEELFGRNHNDGDLGTGDRGATRGPGSFKRLMEVAVEHWIGSRTSYGVDGPDRATLSAGQRSWGWRYMEVRGWRKIRSKSGTSIQQQADCPLVREPDYRDHPDRGHPPPEATT